MSKPKILFFDIETAYITAAVWNRWNVNVSMSQVINDWYVLCWSAAWLGEDYVMSDALHYHRARYKKDPTDDTEILKSIWKLLDEADVVIGHNGDRFDYPKLYARFIKIGLQPPSPSVKLDTLKMAKRNFKFTSNRLDDLGEYLDVGRKLPTNFGLWSAIIENQDRAKFDEMVKYCEQDVELLEQVYFKLQPWDKRHPGFNLFDPSFKQCNSCGSVNIKKNGFFLTVSGRTEKYQCLDCGHHMKGNKVTDKNSKKQKANILRSI